MTKPEPRPEGVLIVRTASPKRSTCSRTLASGRRAREKRASEATSVGPLSAREAAARTRMSRRGTSTTVGPTSTKREDSVSLRVRPVSRPPPARVRSSTAAEPAGEGDAPAREPGAAQEARSGIVADARKRASRSPMRVSVPRKWGRYPTGPKRGKSLLKRRLPIVTAGILAAGGLLAAGPPAGQDGEALAKRYGWTGPEGYKFHPQTTGLRAADLNGDGRIDLVFADNDRARIEVLLQRAPEEQAKPQPPPEDDGPNAILEPVRFRRAPVALEAKVNSLATGDFTGDGRTDLAWFGDDNRLVIAAGQPDGTFARVREWKVEEGSSARAALAAADLNGDGRSDLALLGEKESRVYLSGPDGTFAEPARYPASTEKANALVLVDLDGGGTLDLVLVAPDEERSIRVRFGSSGGRFGPEIPLKLPPIRTATFADADGDGKAEVFAIHRTSGRVGMYAFEPPAQGKQRFPFASVRYHAFEASKGGGEKGRGMALGDLDGDGRPDVLVSEPAGARLVLYRGRPDGGFEEGESFPSFVDGRSVRIADFDGDGRYEAAVLSVEEKAIGLSRFAEGRMTFPRAIPLDGTPAAFDVSDLDGDGKADLAVERRVGKGEHALVVFRHAASGLEPAKTFPLPELPTDPTGLLLVDLDGDRRR